MKIAIIGATGLLGNALIPQLLNDSHQILALSPHPEKAKKRYGDAIETAHCDLLDTGVEAHLTQILEGYDTVVNIATAIPRDFSAPNAWEANTRIRIEGTPRLLNSLLKANVKNYVQQSITLAYPDYGDQWITEDMPLDDREVTAWLWQPVQHMESLLHAISTDELNWSILRGGSFVGKDTFQTYTLELLKNGGQKIGGDGQAYASYVRVEDMADAVKLAIEQQPTGVTLNINHDPVLEADYLKQLADYIGAPHPQHDPEVQQPTSQRCSNQAARDVLGWRPARTLMPDFLGETPVS